jgi:mono/diheme cytochrome c family protein
LTEIPEHLLKRSRERRAALGLGGDAPSGEPAAGASEPGEAVAAATPSAPVPTAAAAATPAPVEEARPEPPKPDPLYVQAAKRRRRVPYWAMPVLAAMPLWGYVFVRTLSPPPVENDPLVLGQEVYTQNACAGCHGATGGGVSGPSFNDGAVIETWPDPLDQMMWVRVGAIGWPGNTYGAPPRTELSGTMPAHPQLSDQELAQVVLYERRVLSNEEPPPPADDVLLQIANGETTFAQAGLGPLSTDAGISESKLEGG